MSLGISWLNAYPRLNSLLARHNSTARPQDASSDQVGEFTDAVEIQNSISQHLRGLEGLPKRPFELKEIPFAAPSEKHAAIPESGELAELAKTNRANLSKDILLEQSRELVDLFGDDDDLRKAFIDGDYQQISEKLALAAKEKLGWSPEITEEFLQQHPEQAMVIVADLGEIVEMLKDPEKAKSLTGNVRDRLEDEIYDRLSGEVAQMMKDSSRLDETFFRLHPRAALYLIEHPEERRRLDGNEDAQKEFIRHVAEYESFIDPVAEAREMAGENPTLGEEFWRDNPDLALALYAERAIGERFLQTTALEYTVDPHESGSPEELVNRDQAFRASQVLGDGSPMDFEYLLKNPHLSRFINENPVYAVSLKRDFRISELIGIGDLKTRRVLQAYVAGLPWRDESYWQWQV